MFKPVERNQKCILPPVLSDLIPDDDLVYIIIDAIDTIDTTSIECKYDTLGQKSYHPKMMIGIFFYAYSQGVFSSRKIEKLLRYDVRFMYLAGMHRPSFNRLCEFKRNNYEQFQDCFLQIVRFCTEMGFAPLASISIDGSKIAASASDKQIRDRQAVTEELKEIKDQIKSILDHAQDIDDAEDASELADLNNYHLQQLESRKQRLEEANAILEANENQKRINFTDLECREQKYIGSGYNVQIAVDSKHQIIVAADVVSDPSDNQQLLPMVEQTERNTDTEGLTKKIIADSGYASGHNYQRLYQERPYLDVYVPTKDFAHQGDRTKPLFDKSNFDFDAVGETCICPLGHSMRLMKREMRHGIMTLRFKGQVCPSCPAKFLCTVSNYRQLRMSVADPIIAGMNRKMATPAGKQALKERRQTVEPVFGQIKNNLGFNQFLHRGIRKVKGEFALLCSAVNLKRLHYCLSIKSMAEALCRASANMIDFLLNPRISENSVKNYA